MDPMKRLRLAVLFLVVGALLAGTTASVKGADFVLLPVGDEPGASGTASVKWRKAPDAEGASPKSHEYVGDLSVSCQGLTPGATYRIDRYAEREYWYWNEYDQWVQKRYS
jgi:hypothetical protein